jgi:NTP pyrophosphatase (non-canonical NTP hydrolase)
MPSGSVNGYSHISYGFIQFLAIISREIRFQWKTIEESSFYLENHKDSVAEELSDVLYWVLLL